MDESTRSPKSSSQSRILYACQRCRSLKAKCMPTNEPGLCQRCQNSKRVCVWPQTQQKKRASRGPSRISQVEKKIDGLFAQISSRHTIDGLVTPKSTLEESSTASIPTRSHGQTYASPISTPDAPYSHHAQENADSVQSIEAFAAIHDFETDSEQDSPLGPASPPSPKQSSNATDDLTQDLLSNSKAQFLLEQYRPMASSFPFVQISSEVTAAEMARRKPMVLLAIMGCAAWRDRPLQATLDKRYKTELANRLYIRPQKTIDLLQSLLVFLAWNHYSVDPKFESASMLYTAVGLAADLKLDPRFIQRLLPGRDPAKRVRGGREGQRALLGCYYLTTMAGSALQTSNLFDYSLHMQNSCLTLEQEASTSSDGLISQLVRLQSLDDQIYKFFRPSMPATSSLTLSTTLPQLQAWHDQINNLDIPDEEDGIPLRAFSLASLKMEMYHSVYRWTTENQKILNQGTHGLDPCQILLQCLESSKSWLDTLISVPRDEFYRIPWTVWLHLPRTIITTAMLTSNSRRNPPGWDIKTARERVRLDLVLESLCFRMQSLTTFSPPTQLKIDFWLAMKVVLESVTRWYKKISSRSKDTHVRGAANSGRATLESQGPSISFSEAEINSYQSTTNDSHLTAPHDDFSSVNGQFDAATELFAQFQGVTCPMMRADTNFDLDRFMEVGFWGHGFDDNGIAGHEFTS